MKKPFLAALFLTAAASLVSLAPATSWAQGGPLGGTGGPEARFQIKNITVNTPSSPQFSTTGGEDSARRYTPGKWLEIEVEFASTALAREVGFKFNVIIGNTLLTGEETLVDVPASQSAFTVMYIAPRTLTTLLRNTPLTPNAVQNIQVQILKPGVSAPSAMKMLKEGGGNLFQTMQQTPGLVLTKPQTPFAPLWWDRYEAVKPSAGGR